MRPAASTTITWNQAFPFCCYGGSFSAQQAPPPLPPYLLQNITTSNNRRRLHQQHHHLSFRLLRLHQQHHQQHQHQHLSFRGTTINATSLPSSPSPAYLDEEDVVSFLDPPKQLIPLDPSCYNPASYLWKKIEDIPEERRHRLLSLLKPRLISQAWEIAGTRYDDPKLAVKSASNLLSDGDDAIPLELWNCRTSGGPLAIAWMNFFKKALFYSKERKPYGRFIGGSLMEGISNSFFPLYFMVRECNEVMSTEQPCNLAYEFGDGILDLSDYPQGFPKPGKHPWPFCDQVVVYVRHLGPGVLVGQAWQEGEALEQVPKKLFGEILMVKDFSARI
ncbi:hypothetical protein ACH5RR_024250 [Cinchona calisaya]|uniref:Uncharacterized protein n=1 Tax=Cinchona calisaya TaxID=153742 RepID=A0ABD2Z164_9GENT